jgi:hypothetical protein
VSDTLCKGSGGFTIEIEILVTQGYVGILLLGDDINAAVIGEYMVQMSEEPTALMITVPSQVGLQRLVLRNTASGTRSQFTLRSIKLTLDTEKRC